MGDEKAPSRKKIKISSQPKKNRRNSSSSRENYVVEVKTTGLNC